VIPTVGLLPVAGVSLKVLTERLYQKMTTSYASLNNGRPGARSFLDVSLGKLKTVRVYVLGEVKTPGGYVLNALSTVFTALYYAGGPTEKGSLREVVLRRAGRDSASIDLYRYLISGDNSLDIHVENGDVVLVKPVKRMVTLQGEVFRPAIYELKEGETFGDLMAIAGGYKHTACLDRIHVQRVVPFTERDKYEKDIIFIDFPVGTTNTTPLEDGDVVTVYPVGKRYQNFVSINGAVEQPGEFELEPAMTVKRLIEKAGGMLPEIFVPKAEIVRTSPDFSQEILSFNVAQALAGNAIDNLQLQNLDKVKIYSINDFKDKTAVTIDGAVRRPGMYPLYDSMTVADLVLQSGGFTDKASPSKEIEVYRQDVASINVYAQEHKVKIPFVLESIEQAQRFVLQQYDMVFVRENPAFEAQKTVQIEGEVLYGGVYPLENDKIRISDIVKKAGGLRSEAFIDACTLKREGKIIYLDLVDALKRPGKSKYDIILIDKDYLHIPKNPYIVDVRGEVMTPTLVLFQKGKGLDYYLEQAGGLSENADDERIQVRLGNGKMWKPRCCWFDPPLKPGTSIVVPVKVEKENKFWENTRDIVGILSSGSTLLYVIYNIIVYK
jgi:protein involved in polysaccharide export with SLBB domain